MKKIIRLTESDLTRIVRRVIKEEEESQNMLLDKNWATIYNSLKTVTDSSGNMPKIINFKPRVSLNWGNISDKGKNKNWGLGIDNDGKLVFITSDEIQSKIFKNKWKVQPDLNSRSGNYSSTMKIDFSNPSEVVSKIKNTILSLG